VLVNKIEKYNINSNIYHKVIYMDFEIGSDKVVYFIRHAEATHNVDFLKMGEDAYFIEANRDSSLTSKGIQQCMKVNPPEVDIVYTSPLTRTLMTTNLIYKYHPNRYATDIIRETNYHHVCNVRKTRSYLERVFEDIKFNMILQYDDFCEVETGISRLKELDYLINEEEYKRIAIVSHGTFLKDYLNYKGLNDIHLDNCGIIKCWYKNGNIYASEII
jgi:broad specificity phosphatase PhoE